MRWTTKFFDGERGCGLFLKTGEQLLLRLAREARNPELPARQAGRSLYASDLRKISRANANHHYGEIAKYFNKLRDKFFISPSGSCSRLPSEWKLRSTNMLLIMHRVCRPALPAALLLIGMSAMGITDAAAQGSPEARQACTPDAMRLCSEFTSDVSNHEMHDGKAGAVERGVPDGDGTRDFPPRRVTICTTDIARTATAADFLISCWSASTRGPANLLRDGT